VLKLREAADAVLSLRPFQILSGVMVFRNQTAQLGQSAGHDIENGIGAVERNLLREMRDARALRNPHFAVIRRDLAGK
jgi:hypothetical protein